MTWFDHTYSYKKQITINHSQVSGGGDLLNFPVLVKFTSADFKQTPNGLVQSASGFDIIFVNGSETAKLDHEIENYNASTGEIEMWVRLPFLSVSVNTTIYCYFGNSAITSSQENINGVWDSNYVAVWHMGDTTTTTVADSTGTSATGTKQSTSHPVSASGEIASAQSFNGSTDFISVASSTPRVTGDKTLECWVNASTFAANADTTLGKVVFFNADGTNVFMLITEPSPAGFQWTVFDSALEHDIAASIASTATWYHVTATYKASGSALALYLNGVSHSDAVTTGLGKGTTGTGRIGNSAAGNGFYTGLLDEVRISNTVRTQGWATTSYNNQSNPATFLTVGATLSSDNTRPRYIPRAFGGTIVPDQVTQPTAYVERGLLGTLIYEIRTFIPRALGGTYIPDTWKLTPRALGGTLITSPTQSKTSGLRTPVRTRVTRSLGLRVLTRTQKTVSAALRTIVTSSVLVTLVIVLRTLVRTQKSLVAGIRARVRTQATQSSVLRTRVRSLAARSSQLRAVVGTTHSLSSSLRTNVRTQATRSAVLRAVIRGITRIVSVRVPVRTQRTLPTSLRTLVRSLRTVSIALRTVVRTTAAKSSVLRAVVGTLHSVSTALRTRVRTLRTLSTVLRVMVTTTGTLVTRSTVVRLVARTLRSVSTGVRTLVRSQVTRVASLRAVIRGITRLSNLRVVVRGRSMLTSIRAIVRGITRVARMRVPVRSQKSLVAAIRMRAVAVRVLNLFLLVPVRSTHTPSASIRVLVYVLPPVPNATLLVREGEAEMTMRAGDADFSMRSGEAEMHVRSGQATLYMRSGEATIEVREQ